jgi:hypothetical protein
MNFTPLHADWLSHRERVSGERQTAYHEAGHAVVDLLVGMRATAVRLYPHNGIQAGYTQSHSNNCERILKVTPMQLAAVKVAGVLSEAIFVGELTSEMRQCAIWDYERAQDIVRCTKNRQRYLFGAEKLALCLLGKNWRAVEAVAESLWTHGELSGNQIACIAREHGASIRRISRSRPRRFLRNR